MYYTNPHIFQTSPDWAHEFGGPGGAAAAAAGSHLAVNGLQVPAGTHGVPPSVGMANGPLAVGIGPSVGDGANTTMTSSASGLQSLPSPPVTVSGSEMSSPGAPAENASPQTSSLDPTPTKSPFQWMTKNPQPTTGKSLTCFDPFFYYDLFLLLILFYIHSIFVYDFPQKLVFYMVPLVHIIRTLYTYSNVVTRKFDFDAQV